jgi:hypothetical protein
VRTVVNPYEPVTFQKVTDRLTQVTRNVLLEQHQSNLSQEELTGECQRLKKNAENLCKNRVYAKEQLNLTLNANAVFNLYNFFRIGTINFEFDFTFAWRSNECC